MLIRGQHRQGNADVITGTAVGEHLARHLSRIPRDARYHGVRLGPGRKPDPADLACATDTTVMVRIQKANQGEKTNG